TKLWKERAGPNGRWKLWVESTAPNLGTYVKQYGYLRSAGSGSGYSLVLYGFFTDAGGNLEPLKQGLGGQLPGYP
ncbi:MAG: hypothetical protein ABEJ96_05695, partial [Thiohalorhabdaceae bacterium]